MREFLRIFYGASACNARHYLRCVRVVVLGGPLLSACSLPVAMPGLGGDDAPTGTIKRTIESPFSAEMDAEDWRRAKSAMDTALDPQGNGAKVAWDNPRSGAKGAFVPLAQPYPKDDGICRVFTARVEVTGHPARLVRSSACRRNGGEWIIGKITPLAEKTAAAPKPPKNLAERDIGTHLN